MIIILTIIQLFSLCLLYYIFKNSSAITEYFENKKKNDTKEKACLKSNIQTNILENDEFQLVKQVIDIQNYMISFIAPNNGFLYIVADYCEIRLSDKTKIIHNKPLDKIYMKKDSMIFIINPIKLRNIRFENI